MNPFLNYFISETENPKRGHQDEQDGLAEEKRLQPDRRGPSKGRPALVQELKDSFITEKTNKQ